MMNKTLFRFIALFLLATPLIHCDGNAQVLRQWGLKSGVSIAQPLTDQGYQNQLKSVSSISVNGYAEWFDHPYITMVSELGYLRKGYKWPIPITTEEYPDGTGQFITSTVKLNTLSFKLMGKARLNAENWEFYALAGPRIDYTLSRSIRVEGWEQPILVVHTQWYERMWERGGNSFQTGLTLGIGAQSASILPLGIGVEVRYNPDFNREVDESWYSIKNRTWEFLTVLTF